MVCLLLVGIFGWSIAKANSADIKVHLGAGTIVMDQQELVLTPDEAIVVQEDTVYLPLRPLMEKWITRSSGMPACKMFQWKKVIKPIS
ncbi:MAG: hypothetical protein LUH17_04825 [Acidaminococcaceae bacterium]|nr:hypothetical protein [Acidaminococcaceae bacterium]